jgi:hypothetical protein
MTVLTKPIKRELPGTFDRREWIVELHGWGINFRAKRTRRSFPIKWDSIFNRCMAIAAEADKRERAERRKAKKAGRL